MRSVERVLGGGAEPSQAHESCRDGTGWKSRASPEGEPLGGWEGEVEEHQWVRGWLEGSFRSWP